MNLTQYLLCALGSLCLYLALTEGAQTHPFTAASGMDLTTVSYLDFASTEVETDASGKTVDQSEAEPSTAAGGSQEEPDNSQSSPPGNSGAQEDAGTSSDSKAAASLLPSAPVPGSVTAESNAMDPVASTPEPWLSLATTSTPTGFTAAPGVLAISPTSTALTGPGSTPVKPSVTMDHHSSRAAEESALGGQGDPPTTHVGTAEVPAVASSFPATVPEPVPSSVPPPLSPGTVGVGGPAGTFTTADSSVSPQGPPVGTRSEVGSTTLDPDHRTTTEAESKADEPGLDPEGVHESKATTGRGEPQKIMQVVCRDWSKLAGKSYVILNMTENSECEAFRSHRGLELLKIVVESFSRKLSTPANSWLVSLSKPSEHNKHLLMMLASDRGTIPAKEVIAMLGDVKENLKEIGIHNITSSTGCQGRPSQPRGDYGKLFIVLVIIGSICAVIIVSGFVYICWQRRLPKLTHMSHGEELHFVENGCHDNPTLDITIDSTVEMQEKKPSVNGDAIERSRGWNALVNKGSRDEGDSFEEDTHL